MIAQAGGLTYNLPQRQFAQQQAQPAMQQQVAQQQQGGSPFDIPMGEDLANVQNLTNNYYTSYGRLKDFTETMWKDYGVDVTKPDFTQPGGGLMHDTFLRMDADLRMAANDLAQQKKRTEEMAKLEAQGKVVRGMLPTGEVYDPTRMLERQFVDAQGRPVSAYVSTDLEDRTLKAIERANQEYYTTGDAAAANAAIQPIRDEYTRLIKENPYQAEYYQKQLNAIMDAQRKFSAGMLTADSKSKFATQGEQAKYLTMARKIANDWAGNWEKVDRYEYDPVLKESVAIIEPESGFSFGKTTINGKEVDKILKRYVKTKDGNVYAEFENPDIPREQTNNRTADEANSTVLKNTPNLNGADAIEFLNRFRGPSGTYQLKDLYAPEEQQAYLGVLETGPRTTKLTEEKQIPLQTIKENIKKSLPSRLGWSEEAGKPAFAAPISINNLLKDYPSVAARVPNFQISKNLFGGKYTIPKDQYKELTGKEKSTGYDALTEDDIINVLSNYVSDILNEAPTVTPTVSKKEIKASEIKAKADAAGQTEENYRAILKRNKVTILENQ